MLTTVGRRPWRVTTRLLWVTLLALLVPFLGGALIMVEAEGQHVAADLEERNAELAQRHAAALAQLDRDAQAVLEMAGALLRAAVRSAIADGTARRPALAALAETLRDRPHIADVEARAANGEVLVAAIDPAAAAQELPVFDDGILVATIRIAPDLAERHRLVRAFEATLAGDAAAAAQHAAEATRRSSLIALATFLGMALALAVAVRTVHHRLLQRRLAAIVEVSSMVCEGDHSRRCLVEGSDELAIVAASVNAMLDRITAQRADLERQVESRTEELLAAASSAERATAAKSAFLAVVSHEIRTPMNAVLGAADLMLETTLDDGQRDLMQTIRSSGDLLMALLNDVLDLSKIEAGRVEIERIPFDLEIELEAVLRAFADRARDRGLDFSANVQPALERIVVGDPTRVRQVLMNLISNAVKFTTEGAVTVEVAAYPGKPEHVRFTVRDTGIGISPEQKDRLFEAFVQADSSTTRKFGGTGLGLVISRRLVELMDGWMDVDSEPGRGSAFSFVVPLAAVTADERTVFAATVGLKGRSVLVVGDDTARLDEIGRLLAAYLVETHWAPAPAAVAAALGGSRPELVIVTAAAEVEWLGALLETAGIPVLVLGDGPLAVRGAAMRRLPWPPRRGMLLTLAVELMAPRPANSAVTAAARRTAPRVLVAEDNEVNQRVVEAMLRRMGCNVVIAADGVEAVAQCADGAFDLVLMDYQMPGLDGPEAARRIRDREAERGDERVAIVALTANAGAEFQQRCQDAGMDDFVTKPMQRAELQRVVDKFAK